MIEMSNEPIPGLCSVLCTTYNHAAYSEQSLQSIFDQTYRNIEIVIVDDGSRDDNIATMRRKLVDSPFPFTLIDQENTGKIGLNVNRAFSKAQGEFVCLLSLDDLLMPESIAEKIELLSKNEDLALVATTAHKEMDGAGNMISERVATPLYGKSFMTAAEMLEHEYTEIGTFYVQGALFRSSLIHAVGGYDEDMTGDDVVLRTKIWRYMLTRPELSFVLLHSPGFIYRKHEHNVHKDSFRQLRTVIEWRDRYFSDRPLPKVFDGWANHFFSQCMANNNKAELQAARNYSPEIDKRFKTYSGSWKCRRRVAKNYLKRKLGFLPK